MAGNLPDKITGVTRLWVTLDNVMVTILQKNNHGILKNILVNSIVVLR
jgi:hypothetical protein